MRAAHERQFVRARVYALGTLNAAVLTAALWVVGVHERVGGDPVDPGQATMERVSDDRDDYTAVLAVGRDEPSSPAEPADAEGGDPPDAADDPGETGEEAGTPDEPDVEHQAEDTQAVERRMSRAAKAVAACESGDRHAGGGPVIGSHQWHIDNNHGGTDSGAFQFVDSMWQQVAAEIGASEYERAKDAPPAVQLEAFQWLWRDGPSAWEASRSCWGPALRR